MLKKSIRKLQRFFIQRSWSKQEKFFYWLFRIPAKTQRKLNRQYEEISIRGIIEQIPLTPLMWNLAMHQDLERKLITVTDENGVEHKVETLRWKPFKREETDGDARE